MSRHNGAVTCVKFSPDGRFLASGSDDKIVLLWEKDDLNRPKQFGEVEQDLEHWTVRKRLVAHDNDVQDLCWSPDGALLVSVGLDRLIIIWNGLTFERIKRYDIHQSMVKGIVFDPANKFFATASDDRTVRIFRYHKKANEYGNYEFQMEHIIIDPFKKSPLTSYFRRMSWSPDGQHIAVPNATNGPVTSVAIISRGSWATDVSLIGHEAPCEVCSFSPRLFEVKPQQKANHDEPKFSTVLATAGQDRSLAVWSTSNTRPIVVAKEITENSITDICWSPDGETLYFSSLDGSITCVSFEAKELGIVVSQDMNNLQLHRYGADRESTLFPESIEQLLLEQKSGLMEQKEEKKVSTELDGPQLIVSSPDKVESTKVTPNKVTTKHKVAPKVTMTKDGKKRVAPILMSSSASANNSLISVKRTAVSNFQFNRKLSQTEYHLPRLGVHTSVHGIKEKSTHEPSLNNEATYDPINDNEDMGIDETSINNQQNVSGMVLKRQRNKLKRAMMETRYPNCLKAVSDLSESLFNNQLTLNHEINSMLISSKENTIDITNSASVEIDEDLIFSVIVSGVFHFENPDFTEDASPRSVRSTIEVRNGQPWSEDEEDAEQNDKVDFQDPTIVIVTTNRDHNERKYILYFPYKIQHALPFVIEGLLTYYVLVSFNGTIQIILAESGNYLCPSFEIGANLLMVKQRGNYLMVLTSTGLIYTWKLSATPKSLQAVVKGVSIATVLNNIEIPEAEKSSRKTSLLATPNIRILEINVADGTPLVVLENTNNIYGYSIHLRTWILVMDSWYYLSQDASNPSPITTSAAINSLIQLTYSSFKNDLAKEKINNYVFTEKNEELKDVMKTKFNELIEFVN